MLGSGRGARRRACARRGEAGSLTAAAAPLALGQLEVGLDHHLDQLFEFDPRLPSQEPPRLRAVTLQQVDLGRPQVARVGLDALAPVELEQVEHALVENPATTGFAGGDHEVVRPLLLQHQPHRLHVVAGKSPVALGVQIAERSLLCRRELDAGGAAGDLAGDEVLTAPRRFVVEQNAVAGKQAVSFAIVDGLPVGVDFGAGVGAARMEGRASRSAGLRRLPNIWDEPAW